MVAAKIGEQRDMLDLNSLTAWHMSYGIKKGFFH